MALVKKRSNSTRLFVVGAVIVAVSGIGYFLFQQFFIGTSDENINISIIPGQRGVITNFGEDILNDSRYTELQPYGSTVNVNANENPGQPNPFQ